MQATVALHRLSQIQKILEQNYCYPNAEYRIIAQNSLTVTLEFKTRSHYDLMLRLVS